MFSLGYEKMFEFSVWLGRVALVHLIADKNKRADVLKKATDIHAEAGKWLQELSEDPQVLRSI